MGRKTYKLKTFRDLLKIENTNYHGCVFYFEDASLPCHLAEVSFYNCSFRTGVFFSTFENCYFENCNFSGHVHIKQHIMPYGIEDKITHLTPVRFDRVNKHFPPGYCDLTSLEFINLTKASIVQISKKILLGEKLKNIQMKTGASICARVKSYAGGTSTYFYFSQNGINYFRKFRRNIYGPRTMIELGPLEKDPVDPEMVDC